jgi:hypothetical protein
VASSELSVAVRLFECNKAKILEILAHLGAFWLTLNSKTVWIATLMEPGARSKKLGHEVEDDGADRW